MKSAYLVVELTKIILCAVSMCLTALFALSFSTDHLGLPFQIPGEYWIAPVLMVVVGLSLDSIKYVFWATGLTVFQLGSLVLVVFSWCASVAFFITQDDSKLNNVRKETPAYLSYQTKVDSLQREIRQKEQLIVKRTSSQFHKQWAEGERLSNELIQLNQDLSNLLKAEASIGVSEARRSMTSSAFFNGLGQWFGQTGITVRNVFYAILALLLELGSIGMVSLSYQHKIKKSDVTQSTDSSEKPSNSSSNSEFNWLSMIQTSSTPVYLNRQQVIDR